MALSSNTIWQFMPGATGSMLNGGGFNKNATFGITDATVDTNTGNTDSPVLSSATYNFVAADVGAWVFVQAGTNWTQGFYQIASVASNKATLAATIGAAIIANPLSGIFDYPSTTAGCATVGTPTGGTIGVDYSQQDSHDTTSTDYVSVGSSTTLTSAAAGFRITHIGNIFHLTTTGTGGFGVVGWYEITAYTSTSSVTTDRTTNNGTALAAGTGRIGGALDMAGALGDSFFESVIGGNTIWIQTGAYTLGAAVAVASVSATATAPVMVRAFVTMRGDTVSSANRPVISCGANAFTFGQYWFLFSLTFSGTASTAVTIGTGGFARYCKFTHTSTIAGRTAVALGSSATAFACEAVSQNGVGIRFNSSNSRAYACYAHDSADNFYFASTFGSMSYCLSESGSNSAVNCSSSANIAHIANCTLYGSEAKNGTGINMVASVGSLWVSNTIIYGFTTGISQAAAQARSNQGSFNDFYNNTTDVSNYSKDATDIAVDPDFAGVTQITGATATTAGSVLTQSGADFSTVTDNVDYCRIVSGTGKTAGIYLITAHTTTTLTLNNAPGTNATADGVFVVPTEHNFAVAGAL